MHDHDALIDSAIKSLGWRGTFRNGDKSIPVAFILPYQNWKPLKAPWWRGKEVCIIAGDLDGNFFLRHCDGTIRHWDHRQQADQVIASSVREFISHIVE